MKILTFPAATPGAAPITHPVHFPTVGQFLDIEALKLSLSGNNYTQLMASQTAAGLWALDLIDAVAHLQVLCPGLGRDLSFGSYLDVPLVKAQQLTSVYKEQFHPWYWPQLRPLLEEAKLLAPAKAPVPTADLSDLEQYNTDQAAANPEAAALEHQSATA